jgi:phosphatidylglycerophosphate synthase
MLRADWVFDDALVRDMVRHPAVALVPERGGEVVAAHGSPAAVRGILEHPSAENPALKTVTPGQLSSSYNDALRKREAPYLLPLSPASVPAIERRMFAGSYKGVTDFVTKYLWPAPARRVTKWCAVNGITPNQVTWLSLALVVAVFALFWNGYYGIGLAGAWFMTFLDTVDGKLARVTLTSTKLGNAFDHGIDLIHPPFWWWAWIAGLQAAGQPLPDPELILGIVVIGYVAQRIQEGVFLAWFKIDIHTWRKFDSWFRLVTARRNPNLAILTIATLFGRPDLGVIAVAIWTVLSFLVHMAQIAQAALAARKGPVVSWLAA